MTLISTFTNRRVVCNIETYYTVNNVNITHTINSKNGMLVTIYNM